jgi:hypothetical protein
VAEGVEQQRLVGGRGGGGVQAGAAAAVGLPADLAWRRMSAPAAVLAAAASAIALLALIGIESGPACCPAPAPSRP